jgi:hypothetical protein
MSAQCIEMVSSRVSRGIMGKGTESFTNGPLHQCPRSAVEDSLYCAQHKLIRARMAATVAARRAARAQS